MRHLIIAAGFSLCLAITAALAQPVIVGPQPAMPPVDQPLPGPQPMPAPPATVDAMPGPASEGAVVHPTPRISYHAGPRARRMLACHEQVELVMVARNPADGCLYEIPFCVPACCEGEPAVREGRGLFGRGIVEYCWPCGFTAKVKFRPVLCDVKVDYSVR